MVYIISKTRNHRSALTHGRSHVLNKERMVGTNKYHALAQNLEKNTDRYTQIKLKLDDFFHSLPFGNGEGVEEELSLPH